LDNDLGHMVFTVAVLFDPAEGPLFDLTVEWEIQDEDEDPVACDAVGARFIAFEITDLAGVFHEVGPTPCAQEGEHTQAMYRPMSSGQADLTVLLLNSAMERIFTAEYYLDIEGDDGDLEIDDLEIEVVPIEVGGDASLTWEWRIGDDYFSAEVCQELGIDYVTLWVWDETSAEWWTDPLADEVPCDAFDHPNDDGIWGDLVYSAIHLESFLPAGQYELYLGFYAFGDEETADVLLYYDTAGPGAPEFDGRLVADGDTAQGTNHYVTVFEWEEPDPFGVLAIDLMWLSPETGELTTCEEAGVVDMGYLLTSDDWVASEVELGSGNGCQDTLLFDGLLITGYPYELLLYGVSDDESYLWYAVCTPMVPETGVSIDEAQGYICDVLYDPPL
jgi:hypothetical protein